jgi:hypothetical protein
MRQFSLWGVAFVIVLLSIASSCIQQPSDVLGIAYVAPASINLRRELSEKNSSAAELKHGEEVQILEVRRRFVKIRTQAAAEGWIDSSQLLTPEQMKQIRQEAARALKLPSEGSATVFEALNIHIDPSRQSPAFAKISETDSVEVLGHKLTPKITGPGKPTIFAFQLTPPASQAHRSKKARETFPYPPLPPSPKAPENWLELSGISPVRLEADEKAQALQKKNGQAKAPAVMEDWTLVRTKEKQCGWVLSRNLIMSIPDEVAQYAEGKRITSYFELGTVEDAEKGKKHDWLWTTSAEEEPYDFDSWRVFIWSRRHHRYETSHRERELEGYFPVHVDPADEQTPERTFHIITRDDDNRLWCRTYSFDGTLVHLSNKEPYQAAAIPSSSPPSDKVQETSSQADWVHNGWERFKDQFAKKRVK